MHLCKPSVYRRLGEEDGVGDRREGEVRAKVDDGYLNVDWGPTDGLPPGLRKAMEAHEGSAEEDEEMRALFAERDDDPDLALRRIGPGRWSTSQNVVVSDENIDRPYLFCMSREPSTAEEWERLRRSLPERYDTWTVSEDADQVQFEIERGIKRWLAAEGISRYSVVTADGFVTYSYESAPPSGNPAAVFGMSRWFRKRTRYRDQAEYRMAWNLSREDREDMPETIDVQLTRIGVDMFKPWKPPVG